MTAAEAVTLDGLTADPHPLLARLRAEAPAAWVPALGGWLITGFDLAVEVMRDSRTFTVDDPRFSTARVVGPSMLSLDGRAHARHRAPFASAFHHGRGGARLEGYAGAEAERLVAAIRDRGEAEIRRDVSGPLAVSVVAEALGLGHVAAETILSLYSRIVGGVTGLSGDQAPNGTGPANPGPTNPGPTNPGPTNPGPTNPGPTNPRPTNPRPTNPGPAGPDLVTADSPAAAGLAGMTASGPAAGVDPDAAAAFADLAARLGAVIEDGAHQPQNERSVLADAAGEGQLTEGEVVSDAAVIMFGGIDTTDGMIANAALHLLGAPDQLALVRADPGLLPAAVEESVRLEPAAAIVDRYATRDAEVGGARIRAGDRVTVSISGANRDPAVFPGPDRFDIGRADAGRHLGFAHGRHFCLGAALARAETQAALRSLLAGLPGLRLAASAEPRGLVFRKPPALHVSWDD